MVDTAMADRFAAEWIESWNSHDLDRILEHYADNFEMSSPLIVERMGVTSGTLKGKEHVRPYWQKGLADGTLHFELRRVLLGARGLTLLYVNHRSQLVAETLIFGPDGKVTSGNAHYSEL